MFHRTEKYFQKDTGLRSKKVTRNSSPPGGWEREAIRKEAGTGEGAGGTHCRGVGGGGPSSPKANIADLGRGPAAEIFSSLND